MDIRFTPSRARGTVQAPPSKSMAHRLLLAAALANGESTVRGVAFSEDILATLDGISGFGAEARIDGDTVFVRGVCPAEGKGSHLLPCRECGSTLRFLIPLCFLGGGSYRLTGSERLLSRPLSVYRKIAEEQGLTLSVGTDGITAEGRLAPGDYTVRGDESSQYISGLLFALPLLSADSTLTVTLPFESRPYVAMTVAALSAFGIRIDRKAENVFHIPGKQNYTPADVTVEGDYSNAAFLDAFTLAGGDVTVTGLSTDSLQGDRIYRDLYPILGNGTEDIFLGDCPDLAPVLFTAAALAGRKTPLRFTGTRRLRIKESDRAAAMAAELGKCGIRLAVEEDSVTVYPGAPTAPKEPLCGHNDHRVVMSLSVLLSVTGGVLHGAEAVKKSYPAFFSVIRALGVKAEEI